MTGRAAGVEELQLLGYMQSITQMAANVQTVMNVEGLFVAPDRSQQPSASQYAGACPSTNVSGGSMPTRGGIDSDPRTRAKPERQGAFPSALP